MAHNRKLSFERFYRRMSIGQLLLLDENLLDYIKLTSPFGEGDDTKKPRQHRVDARGSRQGGKVTAPTFNDARALAARGKDIAATVTTREAWVKGRPHLLDYLNDMEKGRDGRR